MKLTNPPGWSSKYIASKPFRVTYTPGSSNSSLAGKWGPRIESMYFLLNMEIFQPAMLVYQRVAPEKLPWNNHHFCGGELLNFGGECVRMGYDGVFVPLTITINSGAIRIRLPLRSRSVPRNIKKQIVQQTAAITQLSRKKQWFFGLSWLFVVVLLGLLYSLSWILMVENGGHML